MGGACFRVAAWYISSADLRGARMETGGRIHPSGRRADRHPHCYSFLNAYTLADNDSQQDGHVNAYSYADEDANPYKDSICYCYSVGRVANLPDFVRL